MRQIIFGLVLCCFGPIAAHAELSLPSFFSDQMVLQRDCDVAIWGTADPQDQVQVAFRGKTATATADASGHWRLMLPSGPADATGSTLRVSSGDATETIQDVLVGEVWFASGQSNMVFTMNRVPAYAELIAEAEHPQIRMFNAAQVTAVEPQDDIEGEWTAASPETVPQYSAVAFFFARKLHEQLGVPIGVIKSAWGGKPVETFTSREALRTLAGTRAPSSRQWQRMKTTSRAAPVSSTRSGWKAGKRRMRPGGPSRLMRVGGDHAGQRSPSGRSIPRASRGCCSTP